MNTECKLCGYPEYIHWTLGETDGRRCINSQEEYILRIKEYEKDTENFSNT